MTKELPITASYDRPIAAKLIVRLETGEEWDVTHADLDQFRLVTQLDAYTQLIETLERCGLDGGGRHSSLRYVIERELSYPLSADLRMDFSVSSDDKEVIERVRQGLVAWPDDD